MSTLFGIDADFEEYRNNRAIRRRQATADGRRVEILEQPTRVDVTWSGVSAIEAAAVDGGIDAMDIGTIDDVGRFVGIAGPLFDSCHDIIRIAFGSLLFLSSETPEQSYEIMQKLVPEFDLTYGTVMDFSLQMNRPVQASTDPDILINRMSVLNAARSAVLFGLGTQSVGQTLGRSWTQLMVDVSTNADNRLVLQQEAYGSLLAELQQAIRFLANGGR